jgi:hypothetical protein
MLRRFFAILAILILPGAIAGSAAQVGLPNVGWDKLAAQDLPGVLIAMSVASLSALVILAGIVVNQGRNQAKLVEILKEMQQSYVQLSVQDGARTVEYTRVMTRLTDVVERVGQVMEHCEKR